MYIQRANGMLICGLLIKALGEKCVKAQGDDEGRGPAVNAHIKSFGSNAGIVLIYEEDLVFYVLPLRNGTFGAMVYVDLYENVVCDRLDHANNQMFRFKQGAKIYHFTVADISDGLPIVDFLYDYLRTGAPPFEREYTAITDDAQSITV